MRIIESISQVMHTVAMGVLAAMMLLTVADVFLRYVFSRPVTGTTEFTEFMMVCLAALGLAWCAVKRGHLKVDLVMSRFSPRLQAVVDSITLLAGLGVCVVIAWRSFLESIVEMKLGLTASLLEVPTFPFYIVLGLGCAILCLVIVTHLIENVIRAVKG